MIEGYCYEFIEDYIELFREFEKKKCKCRKDNGLYLYIMFLFLNFFIEKCYEIFDMDINILVNKFRFRDKMFWKIGKIVIYCLMFEIFF